MVGGQGLNGAGPTHLHDDAAAGVGGLGANLLERNRELRLAAEAADVRGLPRVTQLGDALARLAVGLGHAQRLQLQGVRSEVGM